MTRKIIIDTDPGKDDALTILLAQASPELEILGIVAVAGNTPLSLTQVNIRNICEAAGAKPSLACFYSAAVAWIPTAVDNGFTRSGKISSLVMRDIAS